MVIDLIYKEIRSVDIEEDEEEGRVYIVINGIDDGGRELVIRFDADEFNEKSGRIMAFEEEQSVHAAIELDSYELQLPMDLLEKSIDAKLTHAKKMLLDQVRELRGEA